MYLKGPAKDIQDQSLSLQFKAYAAIVYLCAVRRGVEHPESILVFGTHGPCGNIRTFTASPKIDAIAGLIGNAFKLIDREEIPREWDPTLDHSRVADWFPTARERMNCRDWLVTLFVAMDLDMNILDRAFPRIYVVRQLPNA